MSIDTDLKKDNIEVTQKIDTLKVNSIARKVSVKLCETFPNYNLDQDNLFIKLSRLNMFFAKMPEGMAEANYFYKNSSIYFNSHIPYDDIEEFAIHECIHYIQEIKDKRNFLVRMGLCDYTEFKIYGLGLNEASVQLMASKVLSIPKEYVKYFNISFLTNSPSYYPLECCLANQLAYIIGEDILFESTINSNNNFKQALIKATNSKTFMTIQNSIDDILYLEEEIIKINNKIYMLDDENKKIDLLNKKIVKIKNSITNSFIKVQNLIISSFFDKAFNEIDSLENLECYRKKLYNFKDYLGSTEGYTYFNDYYVNKMMELEEKYNKLESGLSMVLPKKLSIFSQFNNFIKNLFLHNYSKTYTSEEK